MLIILPHNNKQWYKFKIEHNSQTQANYNCMLLDNRNFYSFQRNFMYLCIFFGPGNEFEIHIAVAIPRHPAVEIGR